MARPSKFDRRRKLLQTRLNKLNNSSNSSVANYRPKNVDRMGDKRIQQVNREITRREKIIRKDASDLDAYRQRVDALRHEVNAKTIERHRLRNERRKEVWQELGYPEQKHMYTEPRLYEQPIDKYDSYNSLVRFESLLNLRKETRGVQGEELKRRLLLMLRGEVNPAANGYQIRGDESGIAGFIEEYVTGEQVDVLFEMGALSFEFGYASEGHGLKERLILHDLIERSPYLNEEFLRTEYADQWMDYYRDNMDGDDSINFVPDAERLAVQEMHRHIKEMSDNIFK